MDGPTVADPQIRRGFSSAPLLSYSLEMTAAQRSASFWYSQVPRLGSEEEFAVLRALLARTAYQETEITAKLNVESMAQFATSPTRQRSIDTPLDALIALFFDCGLVDESAVSRVLSAGEVAALNALNLLVRNPAFPGQVYASAAILPTYGYLTVCDRGEFAPDGSRSPLPEDVVYPAHLDSTRRFVQGLPPGPCDAMLDIGTGTGIAALLASGQARHVWASDITARAVGFAEFNRRLAGVANITVVEGDMYAPVEGLTFDRITTHPPYVPARKTEFVYRDAGEDGEQILRRAVEGLPRMLRPGGRFYSLQAATDRQDELFEDRVRKWLGPDAGEFDVIVAAHTIRTPAEFLADSCRASADLEHARMVVEMWAPLKVRFLVYAALAIERHATARRAFTLRVQTGKHFDGALLDWLMGWRRRLADPGESESLLESCPVAGPEAEMHTISRLREGRFQMQEFTLRSDWPFSTSFRCERWLAQIVASCDGRRTWRELLEEARTAGHVPPGVDLKQSLDLFGLLVSAGLLELPGWLPPRAPNAEKVR